MHNILSLLVLQHVYCIHVTKANTLGMVLLIVSSIAAAIGAASVNTIALNIGSLFVAIPGMCAVGGAFWGFVMPTPGSNKYGPNPYEDEYDPAVFE